MDWICYKFPSAGHANNFVADLAEGHRQQGINYVRSWDRPKRKKGGYWVAVLPVREEPIDALASMFAGERLVRKAT